MNAYRCNENSRLTTLAFNSIKCSQILLNLFFGLYLFSTDIVFGLIKLNWK